MRRKIFFIGFALLSIAFSRAQAQTDQATMKAWTDYMTPGSVHQMLAKADGEWNSEITLWTEPGKPPSKSAGSCVNKMILGGRYQESKHTGNFMGMPFEGISTLGYDNAKKVMQNSWVDNMGTGIMYMEGKWDENTKTANFMGTTFDPVSGKDTKVRETFKLVDDKTQVMEMFMTPAGGAEFKSMEIKFTRK